MSKHQKMIKVHTGKMNPWVPPALRLPHNAAVFTLTKSSAAGRAGVIKTAHGDIQTPVFMPVATAGAMKGITFQELLSLDADILLSNTYHLHLSPGEDTIAAAGGLHSFIGWDKPILTDSGGFQVFSLEAIRKISDDGVEFRDHRSGATHFIGPKEAMQIQHKLGADIIMCFDECPPSTAERAAQIKAVDRTLMWAKVCKREHELLKKSAKNTRNGASTKNDEASLNSSPLLFGIVQGGLEKDLRTKCAEELIAIGFDGYAIGGLAVGESEKEMYQVLDYVCPLLPKDKPRYLMGVGERHQLKAAIAKGIDMFDCVSPMREARHGNIWLTDGTKLKIRRAEYGKDFSPVDADSTAETSHKHSRAYLHHLLRLGERYGETIACLQNMAMILKCTKDIRQEIDLSDEI